MPPLATRRRWLPRRLRRPPRLSLLRRRKHQLPSPRPWRAPRARRRKRSRKPLRQPRQPRQVARPCSRRRGRRRLRRRGLPRIHSPTAQRSARVIRLCGRPRGASGQPTARAVSDRSTSRSLLRPRMRTRMPARPRDTAAPYRIAYHRCRPLRRARAAVSRRVDRGRRRCSWPRSAQCCSPSSSSLCLVCFRDRPSGSRDTSHFPPGIPADLLFDPCRVVLRRRVVCRNTTKRRRR
jgi:hypothetical protein